MERSTLARILADVPGVDGTKDSYTVGADHCLDLHVGDASRPLTLTDLVTITLDDHFLSIVSREDEARHYFDYDSVVGVSVKPLKRAGRRAGFS